jgi:hypothetical protein
MVRVLGLCCGTGIVRKALERIYGPGNYEYVDVDTEAKFGAEVQMDVRYCVRGIGTISGATRQ